MVLKTRLRGKSSLFLLLVLTLFSNSLFALSRADKMAFARGKRYFKARKYSKVIKVIKSRFNLRSKKTPTGALTLVAYSYEKLGRSEKAIKIYKTLIQRKYKRADRKIMKAARRSSTRRLPRAPKKLYYYYHRIAEGLTRTYLKKYRSLSRGRRRSLKKKALAYANILSRSNYSDRSYKSIPRRLKKHRGRKSRRSRNHNTSPSSSSSRKKGNYQTSWYASTSYISYVAAPSLVSTATKTATKLTATADGFCFGGGWRYENKVWEYSINGCYAIASMNVSSSSELLKYQQSGVGSSAILIGGSALWKPESGNLSMGLHVPIVYTTGAYTIPTNYTMEDDTVTSLGIFLEGHWRMKSWGLYTKFGKVLGLDSSLWQVGAQIGI